jgi:hypothetical protein
LDLKNKAKHCSGRAQIFDIIERAYLFMARFTWDFIRDQRGKSTLPAGRREWGLRLSKEKNGGHSGTKRLGVSKVDQK